MAMVASPKSERNSKKQLHYRCTDCKAKEMYLYCWKGCRRIQNISAFYEETNAVCAELTTYKETIYMQEMRIQLLENQLRESQQSLDYVMKKIQSIPINCTSSTTSASSLEDNEEVNNHTLPPWASICTDMIWDRFDEDKDGLLNETEFNNLKFALFNGYRKHEPQNSEFKNKISCLEDSAALSSATRFTSTESPLSPGDFHKLYRNDDGSNMGDATQRFIADLRSLGIFFGSTPGLAAVLLECAVKLDEIHQNTAAMNDTLAALTKDLSDKNRANIRLRDGFADTQKELDEKTEELNTLKSETNKITSELFSAKECENNLKCDYNKMESDLRGITAAAHSLHALVEEQVQAKHDLQHRIWELDEQLHQTQTALRDSQSALWKTREEMKEASRKSRLLYSEMQKGRRHYNGNAI